MKTVAGEEMPEKYECLGSHSRLYVPECLVIEIFSRLPPKSVGRFRCVSTAWLSISTDPSFIVSHTRGIPKSLVLPFVPLNLLHTNELFNFSIGFDTPGLRHNTDVPLSFCDGLVNFRGLNSEGPCANYVLNPLTGLRIDLPSPSAANAYGINSWMRELYYHRWTGEYRLLNVHGSPQYAEVLSLGSAMDSWRRIDAAPPRIWILWKKCVVVNDCLYWPCAMHLPSHCVVVVFDMLEEAFSCMDLPAGVIGCRENYGLVDIEGKLGFWMASGDKNAGIDGYQINIWVEAEGGEKWGSAYSLHLGDEWRRLIYPSTYALILLAFFSRGEIVFIVNGSDILYLLHWDIKSGNHSAKQLSRQPITDCDRILIHKETLIDMATITQHV